MKSISSKAAPADFTAAVDDVCNSKEPLLITRRGGQSVVLLPISEYRAMIETACLLGTPANAVRLLSAVACLGTDEAG